MNRILMAAIAAGTMLAGTAVAQKTVTKDSKSQALKGYTFYKDRSGKYRWKVLDPKTRRTSLYSTKGYTNAGLRNAAAKQAAHEACDKSNFLLRKSRSNRYYSVLKIGIGKDKGKLLGRVAGSFTSPAVARARLNTASALACHK